MFSLGEFVFKTIIGMIGNEPDYKVKKYALGWYDKDVLTEEDLANIDGLIEQFNEAAEAEPEGEAEAETETEE